MGSWQARHTHTWDVVPSVALASHMEVEVAVLGESGQEQLEEGVHIDRCIHRVIHIGLAVRVANVERLVQEDDIGLLGP